MATGGCAGLFWVVVDGGEPRVSAFFCIAAPPPRPLSDRSGVNIPRRRRLVKNTNVGSTLVLLHHLLLRATAAPTLCLPRLRDHTIARLLTVAIFTSTNWWSTPPSNPRPQSRRLLAL
mmetsp:Transcript_2819/g.10747  ORF Transcript_2819/g.10747 Transcript_2819/m.10747 type:complete len:118 (+) Transcript_2819:395-748(+)